MRRKANEAKNLDHEVEVEETGAELEFGDRTVVLRREPMPRKVKLIAAGVEEIRCVCCGRIRRIADAEELGEGWICVECVADNRKQ
jgi:hypothetical protein